MKVETCSFSRSLKVNRDGAEVTSTGRSLNVRAQVTRKVRRPTVGSLTAGTSRPVTIGTHAERFGHWLTLCTINIYLLTYLLT